MSRVGVILCGLAICVVGFKAIRTGHAADTRARPPTTRPTTATVPTEQAKAAPALGPVDQQLGGYMYAAPTGWGARPIKGVEFAVMHVAPEKGDVVRVQVHPKGGAPPEMKAKYAQTVIDMLKRSFAKSNTEVVEQPKVVPDRRFYAKLQEKIKVKGDKPDAPKVATQMRLYRVIGADMIELTAITTSEKPEEVKAVQKMAEDMMLGLRPEK
jgi:hypothetical protein